MALGEHFIGFRDVDHLMFVKVATGIGSGIISDGQLRRGAQGAAGDLGHIHVPHDVDAVCRCGNVGCLEAVASGAAVASQLRAAGVDAASSRDVAALVRGGSVLATQLVREAGRTIGEVLASAVSLLNPSVIVIGGSLPAAGDPCSPACARSSTAGRCRSPPPSCASCSRRPATSPAWSAPR